MPIRDVLSEMQFVAKAIKGEYNRKGYRNA